MNIKDIVDRKELETLVKTGTITQIQATTAELKRLHLSHGKEVYGVTVEATDYTQPVVKQRPNRGKMFDSKLNGNTTIKNAKTNKSRFK